MYVYGFLVSLNPRYRTLIVRQILVRSFRITAYNVTPALNLVNNYFRPKRRFVKSTPNVIEACEK
jgi:hypothetical protein